MDCTRTITQCMPLDMVFQIEVGGGDSPSVEGEGDGKFCWGVNLDGGVNLRRIDFDHSNLFQGQKKLSVNSEHRLKSKLV